jgi:hypothetical protein
MGDKRPQRQRQVHCQIPRYLLGVGTREPAVLENGKQNGKGSEEPLPLNFRPLAGGYFFLLADFLAAGFVTLDFCGFDLADLLAIILLLFWSLTPLRPVSFPAEEPSMADGAAAVNHRGEVSGAEFCQDCFDAGGSKPLTHWESGSLRTPNPCGNGSGRRLTPVANTAPARWLAALPCRSPGACCPPPLI